MVEINGKHYSTIWEKDYPEKNKRMTHLLQYLGLIATYNILWHSLSNEGSSMMILINLIPLALSILVLNTKRKWKKMQNE